MIWEGVGIKIKKFEFSGYDSNVLESEVVCNQFESLITKDADCFFLQNLGLITQLLQLTVSIKLIDIVNPFFVKFCKLVINRLMGQNSFVYKMCWSNFKGVGYRKKLDVLLVS